MVGAAAGQKEGNVLYTKSSMLYTIRKGNKITSETSKLEKN